MRLLSRLRPRFTIPLCMVLAGGGFAIADSQPRGAITIQHDTIWVYYTSLCARAGDASECSIVPMAGRPSFESHQACSDHRDADLAREANPRLLGNCQKQHEA